MSDLSQFGLGPAGTISPTSGTFTPSPVDAVSANDHPNPFVSFGEWGFVTISNLELPGVVQSVDGAEKPEEWSVQKGTKSSGATTVWKGTKLAEDIKIVMAFHDAASFARAYEVRDALRPKLGTKPPSHLIFNAAINFNGITRISVKNIGAPKWVAAGGYWTWEISLIEYNPSKPTNTGPAGQAWVESGKKDPNSDVKAELQKALDAAAKA